MATGKAWTEQSVHGFRQHRDIAALRDGEWAERGEITLETTAKIICVCNMTALRMLRRDARLCPFRMRRSTPGIRCTVEIFQEVLVVTWKDISQ